MNGLDPRADIMRGAQTDPVARLEGEIAELRRRLDAQRNKPTISSGSGPPIAPLPDNVFYIDELNNRLYVGVDGAPRYVGLT